MPHPGPAIKKLRELRGWTTAELAAQVQKAAEASGTVPKGIGTSDINRMERGLYAVPMNKQRLLATVFGMSLDEFEKEWRSAVVPRTQGGPGIPVINRAPAGGVIDYEEYGVDSGQGWEYIDRAGIDDDLAFAIEVVGDSMEPALYAGDRVVFTSMNLPKPRAKLEDGCVVFVRFGPKDHEPSRMRGCTLGRWHTDGDQVTITKDNPRHRPVFCDRREIEQLAVAIERRTRRV